MQWPKEKKTCYDLVNGNRSNNGRQNTKLKIEKQESN